ncbi:hypothetical protein EYC80_003766 [Monilinia laxa]|uniref:DUF7918 domain-containing protein n=1 Tax=Monilinia laxa TaxID=61186 RepID=A0A5N6KL21_MONLA|nr:hypothetical protein EYC80_003766 [Monilinia laxa]
MVVFSKLPHLGVSVQVDGVNVQEYDDDEEITVKPGPVGEYQAARTVSKFIEAVDGAEFGVKCSLSPQFKRDSPNIEVAVYVDGNYASGLVIRDTDFSALLEGRVIRTSDSSRNGDVMQKFRFSRLDISSEETRLSSLKQEKNEAEKIGAIEVRIWRASKSTPAYLTTSHQYSAASNKFHEKAFKGQAETHNVSYSTKTPIPAQNFVKTTKLDGKDYPIAIYKFKYRSKGTTKPTNFGVVANIDTDALKQLLIIERTPEPEYSPSPSPESDVDLGNLTDAQRERLKAFLRNEGIAAGGASNTPREKSSFKTTEIVDLTADSDEDG